MPTGYTSFIEDGMVKDAKTFLHLCLRNFGVCSSIRENPLKIDKDYSDRIKEAYDEEIDYHMRQLTAAEKRFGEFISKSEDELKKEFEDYITSEVKEIEDRIMNSEKASTGIYQDIMNDIMKWDCPDDFKNIKKFALDQLEQTLKYDYGTKYDNERLETLKKETFEEYRETILHNIEWDIDYNKKEISRIAELRDKNLDFYRRFKEELNKI